MRLHAYVLAADPTWIARTVPQWYPYVDRLVVSFDADGIGWAGAPVPVQQCRDALKALDFDHKIVELPGNYSSALAHLTPMEKDTAQRQAALRVAGEGADWVLQLDTDELLPDPATLLSWLTTADVLGCAGLEWPMRVLFRRTRRGFLQVINKDRSAHFEYPGPIAVRPEVALVDCRRIAENILRVCVEGDNSLQLQRPAASNEVRRGGLPAAQAVIHNSWARERSSVHRKVRSWGHSDGWRSRAYFWATWFPAPLIWRWQRDLHPFSRGLWQRLGQLPTAIAAPETVTR